MAEGRVPEIMSQTGSLKSVWIYGQNRLGSPA
jgi:hypothetical protein